MDKLVELIRERSMLLSGWYGLDMPVMLRKLDTARAASAAWKASAKKWRKYWHWRAGYCAAAEKRVAELEEALKTAIDAIRLLDDYSMGFVCDEDRGIRWPIRDELVDNLCKALNK